MLAEAADASLHDHQTQLVLFVIHTDHAINKVFVLLAMVASTITPAQDKKKAEADRQKELNDLFAIAIKQPKVPPGEDTLLCARLADRLLMASFHSHFCMLLLLLKIHMRVWISKPVAQEHHQEAICFAATKLATHIHGYLCGLRLHCAGVCHHFQRQTQIMHA